MLQTNLNKSTIYLFKSVLFVYILNLTFLELVCVLLHCLLKKNIYYRLDLLIRIVLVS
jgi:hypothetical protein